MHKTGNRQSNQNRSCHNYWRCGNLFQKLVGIAGFNPFADSSIQFLPDIFTF